MLLLHMAAANLPFCKAFPEMSTKQSTGQSHGSEADVPQPMNTKKSVANVVVAKYLDRASRDVQIQALEV